MNLEWGNAKLMKPIPLPDSISGWQGIQIQECGEPLVRIRELDSSRVICLAAYFNRGFQSANDDLYIRRRVAELLLAAADQLPEGLRIGVFDAWRSSTLQKEIFDRYVQELRRLEAGLSEEALTKRASVYVSVPTTEPTHPAPHITGGALDLTLCDERGYELEMGTDFDHFGPKAAVRYFEEMVVQDKKLEAKAERSLWNRRLLFNVMANQGFTNYSEEWWHFDYGNQFWARLRHCIAFYGSTSPA